MMRETNNIRYQCKHSEQALSNNYEKNEIQIWGQKESLYSY